jgi:hypothetical protein
MIASEPEMDAVDLLEPVDEPGRLQRVHLRGSSTGFSIPTA